MKLSTISMMLVAALALSACTGKSKPRPELAEGFNVGNGMVMYSSPYRFSLEFRRELRLDVPEGRRRIRVDNRPLVAASQKPSEVVVDVLLPGTDFPGTATEYFEQLRCTATARFEGDLSDGGREVSFPGAEGFTWESRTENTLEAEYVLLTSHGRIVRIVVDANASGFGLSWVAPVVATFRYDSTPPTILEFAEFHPLRDNVSLLVFRAVDERSPIAPFQTPCAIFSFLYGDDERDVRDDVPDIKACGPVQELGGDWFGLPMRVPHEAPRGRYYLREFHLSDGSGNLARLSSGPILRGALGLRYYDGTTLDVLSFVLPDAPATHRPAIVSISVPERFKLSHEAGKGVQLSIKNGRGTKLVFGEACIELASDDPAPQSTTRLRICGGLHHLGGESYELEARDASGVRPGRFYVVSVVVGDRTGLHVSLEAIRKGEGELAAPSFVGTQLRVPRFELDAP